MALQTTLPALHTIIYHMEDRHTAESNLWLDITQGRLAEVAPEVLEARPELLGTVIFPLPPWNSVQGYNVMLEFGRKCELGGSDAELLKILRSRNQVFKRYRNYLKDKPQLKQAWQQFKEQHFCEYLQGWYTAEFPQARELLALLRDLSLIQVNGRAECGGPLSKFPPALDWLEDETQADLAENLLYEDFTLCETIVQSPLALCERDPVQSELQALALLDLQPNPSYIAEPRFDRLRYLCGQLTWLNRVELMSPAGECVACLYWAWGSWEAIPVSHQARVVLCISREDYSPIGLGNYLLDQFLQQLCPKHGVQYIDMYLGSTAEQLYAEALLQQNITEKGRVCSIQIPSKAQSKNQGANHK